MEEGLKKDWLRGFWRLAQPVRITAGKKLFLLPLQYWRFLDDRRKFISMGGDAPFSELQPCFSDRQASTQSGGGQYFYQDIWALKKLAQARPGEHHDIGSRLDGFVGQATAICPVVYWDIRPPQFQLPGFQFRLGGFPRLPVPDHSISSLSCLHVAEHIGLGRYGERLDPLGTQTALAELMRILAPGGQLLLSMPIGQERVCFNAQRVWHPERPIAALKELRLMEFSAVNDSGEFLENASPTDLAQSKNSCGLYRFERG